MRIFGNNLTVANLRSQLATYRGQLVGAGWLYFFLALQAYAQFFSLSVAPRLDVGVPVALAVARYSLLVFIIVNVVRSERLLKAILVAMGCVTVVIMAYTYVQYFMHHGDFQPGQQESILGINVAHYLAYALLMNGAGLVYLFLRGEHRRSVWYALVIAIVAWLQMTILHTVKISQVATFGFLVLVFVVAKGVRIKAGLLVITFFVLFFVRFHIITIRNQSAVLRLAFTERVHEARSSFRLRREPTPTPPTPTPLPTPTPTPPTPTPLPTPTPTPPTPTPLPTPTP
ncbi:MAG: hypothetical protein Q7S89_01465, partial [bacterium]|nr:hypothetical protein [bacterium]